MGSCDQSCTAFIRWRVVGTSAWTNAPSFNVPNTVSNVPWHQGATGLAAGSQYEYQACGKESSYSGFVCVGPDGQTSSTQTFTTPAGRSFASPGTYSWTVPAGVTRAQFDLAGAEGGRGALVPFDGTHDPRVPGGRGAHVRAVLAVRPGDTLTIVVGGRGGDAPADLGAAAAGGSNGGGAGGAGGGGGGGGGGATDARSGSGLSARLLVAGGGGGGDQVVDRSGVPPAPRGGAGGLVGQNGHDGTCANDFGPCTPAQGGGGGTATAGGTTQPDSPPAPPWFIPSKPGGFGVGGDGGTNLNANMFGDFGAGGGGGGAGYYGGGGGAEGYYQRHGYTSPSAGGGGSSFINRSALCSSPVDTGAQSGDGAVTITYNPGPC